MKSLQIIKILPMIALLIMVVVVIVQLVKDKNSILNSPTHMNCVKSVCVITNAYTECIYLKELISYVDIKNNEVVLTQTETKCQIK